MIIIKKYFSGLTLFFRNFKFLDFIKIIRFFRKNHLIFFVYLLFNNLNNFFFNFIHTTIKLKYFFIIKVFDILCILYIFKNFI